MKFTYKTAKELSELTAEQQDFYTESKRTFEANETKEAIKAALDQFKIDNPAEKSPISKEQFDELVESVNQIKEQGAIGNGAGESIAKQIANSKDKLKAISKNRSSSDEVVIKADTVRASIATNNHTLQIAGIGQLGTVVGGLYDLCTKVPVKKGNHLGTIAYTDWDEDSIARSAAVVAEGVAFAESTAKFKGYTLPLRKIGDTLPVSEEFFEDEEMAAGELNAFIDTNVTRARDTELITGDNTGQHLKGLMSSVPAYTAVAAGISTANIYDLFVKMRTTITTTRGSKYKEFKGICNQGTIDRLVLAKDANDNYLFPPQHPVYNSLVVDNNMADNKMVVGDFKFAKIYEMGGIALSAGTPDAQFNEDMMTLKARVRLAFLIRTVDATGFLSCADIDAALATLSTVTP
jgi:HK97 family phage major capsid protein